MALSSACAFATLVIGLLSAMVRMTRLSSALITISNRFNSNKRKSHCLVFLRSYDVMQRTGSVREYCDRNFVALKAKDSGGEIQILFDYTKSDFNPECIPGNSR